MVKLPKNIVRVLVEGIERAQLVSLEENPNYLEAQIAVFEPEEDLDETVKEAMLRSIKELFVRYCNSNKQISKELAGQILELENVEKVLDQISTSSPTLITPASIRPVATVPRPVIENTSSTGIKNGSRSQ